MIWNFPSAKLNGSRALFESGDVSERELEQAESNFANAKTAVGALIAVSSAETNLVSVPTLTWADWKL